MSYNPQKHHRRSIRLKGYDYTQAGYYFITICTQNRLCLFGDIENGVMVLNDAGKMVENWYYNLNNKYPDIKCHTMVVMPNHFHCVIENTGRPVGADPSICPNGNKMDDDEILGEHKGSPLQDVVRWFKTMTTNYYIRGVNENGWHPFPGKLWQRNYWEHIIRNQDEYKRISAYIINNPMKWDADKLKFISK